MARKRSIIDSEQFEQASETQEQRKRTRTSPSTAARSDSSGMSPDTVSEVSAMESTPDAVMRGQEGSITSATSNGNADDSDSSMQSSDDSTSEDEEEDDDEEKAASDSEDVVTLGAPKKPKINIGVLSGANDLASRLKAFLPQMQQANSELAEKGAGLSMEDVDDEEPHIEMSLGLGVLEQKQEEDLEAMLRKKAKSGADHREDEESDSSAEDSEDEPDVLDRLMNMEREGAKAKQPSIQEVECRPDGDRDLSMSDAPSEERRKDLSLRQSGPSAPT